MGLYQINLQLSVQRKDKVMQLFLKQYEDKANISEIRNNFYRDFDRSNAREVLVKNQKEYNNELNNIKTKNKQEINKRKEKIDEEYEKKIKKEYKEFVINFIIKENNDRYKNLLILTDFYNGIASCVESGLCDEKVAKNLFKDEGARFFKNYNPIFCHFKTRWKDSLIKGDSAKFYEIKKMSDRIEKECRFLLEEV